MESPEEGEGVCLGLFPFCGESVDLGNLKVRPSGEGRERGEGCVESSSGALLLRDRELCLETAGGFATGKALSWNF